jgi:response regulator RpfG family c-di-GMP phosphodiesterase
MASPMHDVGKVAIPDSVLLKPGKLTEEEFEIMKTHVNIGHDIFARSKRSTLKAAAIVAGEHHEKFNGEGYPNGLKGDEIHIYGRIVALVDVFDALSHSRCYKEAWDSQEVLRLLEEEKGQHFDPNLVDAFVQNMDEVIKIMDAYPD